MEKHENVDQDGVNWVAETIHDYQINFLTAWNRIHGGEWKTTRKGPVKIGPPKPAPVNRLRLKPRVNKEKIKELIGDIRDKRFIKLQKLLIWDLDRAQFKTIDLGLYMRLGGWCHIGGTYFNAMIEVLVLCRAMFGYELPEKIGKIHMKDHRYRTPAGLAKIAQQIEAYHTEKMKKL